MYFVSFVVDEFRTLPNPESSPWPRQIATCRTSPAYWEQNVYYAGINGSLDRYSITSGLLSSKPVSKSTETFPYPGATPSVCSWDERRSASGDDDDDDDDDVGDAPLSPSAEQVKDTASSSSSARGGSSTPSLFLSVLI